MESNFSFEQMRNCVLAALRRGASGDETALGLEVARVAVERGILEKPAGSYEPKLRGLDNTYFQDTLWLLIIEGVLAVEISGATTTRLTEYGRECLNAGELTPHDPEGYLSRLGEARALDEVEKRFIPQALDAYRRNLPDASAVMLGCASEHLIGLLGIAVIKADSSAEQRIAKARRDGIVHLIKYLDAWLTSRDLPPSLKELQGTTFTGISQFIRITRNDAGHPSSQRVDRDACLANLLLFKPYRDWVAGTLTALAASNPNI